MGGSLYDSSFDYLFSNPELYLAYINQGGLLFQFADFFFILATLMVCGLTVFLVIFHKPKLGRGGA